MEQIQSLPANIMVSDALRDQLPDDFESTGLPEDQFVVVVAVRNDGSENPIITGVLRTVLFDVEPEIEFKVLLSDSFDIIQAQRLGFEKFELHYGKRMIELVGPFTVKAARIQDIDVVNQMCVLALHMQRVKKV